MTRNKLAGVVAALAALLAAGCASSSSSGASSAPPSFGQLEKSTLTVSVVPAMDSAGFFIALHQGLFSKVGLKVKYVPAVSSKTALQGQEKGQFDVTAGNYVSYIQAQVNHQADLQIIEEGSIAIQGSQVIFTLPGSPITSLRDLEHHSLAFNAPGNIDYLLDASVLADNGVNIAAVKIPKDPIEFPQLIADLAQHKYDAVTLPEPFASIAQQQVGAVALSDLDQGATTNFPIEGYVVTKKWARENPNTLKAFDWALEQGQQIADTDRGAVEQAFETIPKNMIGGVPPAIASTMAVNTYPLGIDATRLQRVANVMFQFHVLPSQFSIKQMLAP